MDYLKKSRIEEVLIAILGKGTVTSQLISRIEKILDAIRVKGSYDGIAMSEVEEILVCILTGAPFEKPTHSRIAAMLKVKANGGEYTELRKSRVEELIFEWINAVESATYTGTLPATLQTVEGYLEQYKIYGNTVQNGTPTPENPIVPSGCGEKVDITGLSEPLCGIDTYRDILELSTGILTRKIKKLVLTGEESYSFSADRSQIIFAVADGQRCIPYCSHYIGKLINGWSELGDGYIAFHPTDSTTMRICDTAIASVADFKSYLAAQYANGTPVTVWYVLAEPEVSTIPVSSGLTGTIEGYLIQDGTPSPETPIYPTANGVKQADDTYSIPYGYKLPLAVNGVEYPIYLGESQTTRRIKKLVLTGEETWYTNWRPTTGTYGTLLANNAGKITNVLLCTHFEQKSYDQLYNGASGISTVSGNVYLIGIRVPDTLASNDAEFRAYLAAQYANGTPVTVWYVLAEPETGIVNELLMKIGDYADTIDSTQAGVQIPTAAGTTVIDYDGTPKPDKVELTYSKPK